MGAFAPAVARDFLCTHGRRDEPEAAARLAEALGHLPSPSTRPPPTDLNNLAQLLKATNRLEEAEPLMRRVLAIFEASLGTDHPNTRTVAETLAAPPGRDLKGLLKRVAERVSALFR